MLICHGIKDVLFHLSGHCVFLNRDLRDQWERSVLLDPQGRLVLRDPVVSLFRDPR